MQLGFHHGLLALGLRHPERDEPDRFGTFRLKGGGAISDPYDDANGWLTAVDASSGAIGWNYPEPRHRVLRYAVTLRKGNASVGRCSVSDQLHS